MKSIKSERKGGFSEGLPLDLKRLNKALQERKKRMKLTQQDKDRTFCYQSEPLKER
ncbi:hypothetical protein [Neptuniibacter sp. QD37_11]|uniref:hypothetical protein n=1 Tax=Neptuniibacter sp. QD37_11 TaxID=3398209 RepID=UPI0039F4BB04